MTHTKLWPDFFFYIKVLHNASKSDTLTLSDSLKTAIELKNKIIKNKDDFTFLNDARMRGWTSYKKQVNLALLEGSKVCL